MHQKWIPLALALGCSGQTVEETTATPGKAGKVTNAGEAPTVAAGGDDGGEGETFEQMISGAGDTEQHLQTPSPKEMKITLDKAGVQMALPATRTFSTADLGRDHLAVQTGVLLADLVLTVDDSTTEQKVAYLNALKASCESLDVGEDIPGEVDSVREQVESGALDGPKLVHEFDELHGVMVPELEQEDAKWLVPLVQAGSWLEGAHLVSGALRGQTNMEAANNLLRQPTVVRYFQRYVSERAADPEAPAAGVIKTLQATLTTLETVSSKDSLSQADIETIHSETGKVLAILN